MRPVYTNAARSPARPRGKWHLLINRALPTTICGERASGWDVVERASLDPNDICAHCLRGTP